MSDRGRVVGASELREIFAARFERICPRREWGVSEHYILLEFTNYVVRDATNYLEHEILGKIRRGGRNGTTLRRHF